MIIRSSVICPKVRAGVWQQRPSEYPRSWIQPGVRQRAWTVARERRRREKTWGWLSVLTLIVCWDVSTRLDERVIALTGQRPMVEDLRTR